ncbi:hypothetical protein L6164_014529 [Bauhinia variegata]|uniref:Uncharacterized protein n=1 Tax=Bauhinia variegata TaxID=167791 RepID=A0ACB9NHT2_BAUVA|nr:hypothetical protein L6164_014529 [Bauhinia variegata]
MELTEEQRKQFETNRLAALLQMALSDFRALSHQQERTPVRTCQVLVFPIRERSRAWRDFATLCQIHDRKIFADSYFVLLAAAAVLLSLCG